MPEDFAFPLSEFYARAGLPLPRLEIIPGEAMPEPYRSLLVHEREMTLTLERFHDSEIYIRAQGTDQRNGQYFREVVLHLAKSDVPVEFGANCVSLASFPADARRIILEERIPLGRILKDYAIPHTIRVPRVFQVEPDGFICGALRLASPVTLYGRQAVIFDSQQQPLSQVVEILPPTPPR